MKFNFTPLQEEKIAELASLRGISPEDFVRQWILEFIEEHERNKDPGRQAEQALDRGELLSHPEAGELLDPKP